MGQKKRSGGGARAIKRERNEERDAAGRIYNVVKNGGKEIWWKKKVKETIFLEGAKKGPSKGGTAGERGS